MENPRSSSALHLLFGCIFWHSKCPNPLFVEKINISMLRSKIQYFTSLAPKKNVETITMHLHILMRLLAFHAVTSPFPFFFLFKYKNHILNDSRWYRNIQYGRSLLAAFNNGEHPLSAEIKAHWPQQSRRVYVSNLFHKQRPICHRYATRPHDCRSR